MGGGIAGSKEYSVEFKSRLLGEKYDHNYQFVRNATKKTTDAKRGVIACPLQVLCSILGLSSKYILYTDQSEGGQHNRKRSQGPLIVKQM